MPIQPPSVHLTSTGFHKILSCILYSLRSHTFLMLVEVWGLEVDGLFREKQPKINLEQCTSRNPHFRSIHLLCTYKTDFSAEVSAKVWSLWLPLKWDQPGMRASKYIPHTCPAVPWGKAHCAICCLQHSRGMPVIFSKQKCWHGTRSGNTFSLLAELSSFFKKIHPFGFLP